jgi:cGMP-dependent protein kinase
MGSVCFSRCRFGKYKTRDSNDADSSLRRNPNAVGPDRSVDPLLKSKSKAAIKKGQVIRDQPYVEAGTAFVVEDAEKNEDDRKAIIQALNNHFIFTSLTEEDKDMVVQAMQLYIFEPLDVVFEQHQKSKSFYVVRTGILEVIADNRRVNKIREGQGFGELALLHDNPRVATVKCLDKVQLWGVDRTTFRRVIEEMNTQIYELNRQFLDKVQLLENLSSFEKDTLAASLVTVKYNSGQKIITEGEPGHQLFIIKEGVVLCQRNGVDIVRFGVSQYFGETALLKNTPRTASCIAIEGQVKCGVLTRETLQKVLGDQLTVIIHRNTITSAMKNSAKLSLLSKDQMERIRDQLSQNKVFYKAGDVVIKLNASRYSMLYFILEGNLKYARTGSLFADKGTCVGADYVLMSRVGDEIYEDDIIAGAEMHIGEMTKYKFESTIEGKFEDVIKENAATNILRQVPLFQTLSINSMKSLFSIIKIMKFGPGEVIIQENIVGEAIYIVKRGKVDILVKGNVVRVVTKHDYFGERSAIFEGRTTATCVAQNKVTLWVIAKNLFAELGANIPLREKLERRMKLQDERVQLFELIVIRLLGRGMFGKVYLVKAPTTGSLYALKAIPRTKIEIFAIQEHLLLEKRILQQLDHPFVAKLVRTYKDSKRLYFLEEYVHGLELAAILRHVGLINNSDSQFYIASLCILLQYLHERDIIYRDLKPENIMVDTSGFIKLIDFGAAKTLQGRTFTLVGTPHYMAPEVIVGKGYNKSADLWSLGVCLYELVCGGVPFGEDEEDPYKIYEAILDMRLDYPPLVDQNTFLAKGFIEQLMSKSPEMRSSGGAEALKKHSWFEGFDWESLNSQTIVPPYTPDVGDMYEDIEEDQYMTYSRWDEMLDKYSEESEDSLPDIHDTELDEFKSTIPQDWDIGF